MKHKILNLTTTLAALAVLSLSLAKPTEIKAQYSTTETKKEISIDKTIRGIGDTQYFDNIESSRKVFYENDVIEFKIKVENTGNQDLVNIKASDKLPNNLTLIFFPGTYNSNERLIEWTIDRLSPGEHKEYLVRAKVTDVTEIKSIVSRTNNAKACSDNTCDDDNASYFIGKSTVPATGAGDLIVKTIGIVTLVASGLALRKYARGY